MKRFAVPLLVSAALAMPLAPSAAGFQDDRSSDAAGADAAEEETDWRDELSQTEHSVWIGGKTVPYTAIAGTLPLMEEDGKVKAHVFFVAYLRNDVANVEERPVMFTFNGGPGSSSVWLHLGAFGPRRVPLTADPEPTPPPYRLVDNEHSVLDLTDLVFIDPVTTGFSRAVPGEDDGQYHGVDEDIRAVAEFIRLFCTRFERWASPKLLAGESYGTTRAAGLASYLQDRHGMFLNGLVLVSSILNFQTARFDDGNDLPYPLFLPTYTATAWFHGQLADDLQADLGAALEEAEHFAIEQYLPALALGDGLSAAKQDVISRRLARYTGLSPAFVQQSNLRVPIGAFVKELLRDQRRTVGRLDSRYRGRDRDAAGDSYEYDASYSAIQGPYTAMLNHYVRGELDFESDLPYEILTGRVRPWNFGQGQGYVDVAEDLRSAMNHNPHLRVFVANGYYDLATPYFATEYTFSHLGLEPELSDHVTMGYYEAGHMMYIHEPSLAKLKTDVAAFLGEALDTTPQRGR